MISRGLRVGVGGGLAYQMNAAPGIFSLIGQAATLIKTSASSGSPDGFPRIALQPQAGSQLMPSSSWARMGQFHINLIGGSFEGWPTASGITRQSVVQGIKAAPGPANKKVYQYWMLAELGIPSTSAPTWEGIVNSANWWLYASGSGGTKIQFDSGYFVVNMTHFVTQSGGLWPYQAGAKYMHDLLYGGTIGPAGNAAPALDGWLADLTSVDPHVSGDWNRDGSSDSNSSSTTQNWTMTGMVDLATYTQANYPGVTPGANAAFGTASEYGQNPNPLAGKFGITMQQFYVSAGLANAIDNFAGTAGIISAMQAADAAAPAGGLVIHSGAIAPTDYQTNRYFQALGAIISDKGYPCIGSSVNDPEGDLCDPTVTNGTYQVPNFDELFGGSLNTAGYLGARTGTGAQGVLQTASWSNGVWRADFVNGIALMNSKGNGARAVSLGGAFFHLRGTQVPSINNGLSVTSVTLQDRDGLFLLRNAPP
jgi:hypothetical protein